MQRFQWNSLRTGDRVLVHDDHAPGLDTHEGVVAIVEARRGGTNDVGIRIETSGQIVRPRRHAVHQLPLDRRFWCWRCDATGTQAQSGEPGVAA